MEYDPTVSTHKASSITSTTSTSSSTSTWDHPIMSSNMSSNFIHQPLKSDEEVDYNHFTADKISTISTTPAAFVDYHASTTTEEDNQQQQIRKRNFSDYVDTFISTDEDNQIVLPELMSPTLATNIKKENYHEKITASSQQQHQLNSNNNVTLHETVPMPIYLQHGDQITVPSSSTSSMANHYDNRKRDLPTSNQDDQQYQSSYSSTARLIRPSTIESDYQRQRSNSVSSISSASKRSKLNRDVLTDDEKRVNHIASEQKRRNTIRLGFEDLTEIIPTLKNVNNSKSTILFKAVEFIKHLDKRNRNLREKVSSLQVRMTVEGSLIEQQQRYRNNSLRHNKVFGKQQQQQQQQQQHQQQQQQQPSNDSEFSHLPAHTVSALMAHKNQQRQLEQLQEQLRAQQQLLQKHNLLPADHHSLRKLSLPTSMSNIELRSAFQPLPTKMSTPMTSTTKEKERQYNSLSIPSSRSSNSDENEASARYHHPSLTVPQDLDEQQHHQSILQLSSSLSTTKRRPWHSMDANVTNL